MKNFISLYFIKIYIILITGYQLNFNKVKNIVFIIYNNVSVIIYTDHQ